MAKAEGQIKKTISHSSLVGIYVYLHTVRGIRWRDPGCRINTNTNVIQKSAVEVKAKEGSAQLITYSYISVHKKIYPLRKIGVSTRIQRVCPPQIYFMCLIRLLVGKIPYFSSR
jgi:hypothetical protein